MPRCWIAVPIVLALAAGLGPRPSAQTAPAGQTRIGVKVTLGGQPVEGGPRGVAPIEGAERR